MTRGWNGRGGVHLFGKLAARAGLAVQVGFGVYRFMNATNSTDKAKAAIGTGAGIVGGYVMQKRERERERGKRRDVQKLTIS
jgi:hypothetical protein